MEPLIKKLKIKKETSSKMISNLPNLDKISPIKEYAFQKKFKFPNDGLNKNASMDSFFDSSKKLNVKLRNKNKSFIFTNKIKKFNTGELSNLKLDKTHSECFSSFNKLNNQSSKNSNNIIGKKISLCPEKKKTIFQRIIECIDKIKKDNEKAYKIVKKNERKSISLKIKNFTNWKNININTLMPKLKEENKTSFKNIKIDTSKKIYKPTDEELKSIIPATADNLTVSLKKDINFVKLDNDTTQTNFEKMHHTRNLKITKEQLQNHFAKAGIITQLWRKTLFINSTEMQMNDIFNKIRLILDNIDFFKANYYNNGNFYLAFENMNNMKKAKLNLTIEELCFLLIKIPQKLLLKFYKNLDKFLYVEEPDIKKEMEKIPKNEKECLNINCSFLNSVSVYFAGCAEVLKEIKKRIDYYKFSNHEFLLIDNFLDLARFDTSKINSIAEIYIEKLKKDKEILEKLEIGIGIKKKKRKIEDIFERNHKRYTQNFKDEIKLERINSSLNLKNKYLGDEKRMKFILMRRQKNLNILNQPIVRSLMKYLKDNIKSQIISQQLFERYILKERQEQIQVGSKNNVKFFCK